MADLARSIRGVSTEEARRCLVRHVYRHTQEPAGETSDAVLLPPVLVWVSQLARLQRASLALCVFGGLTIVRRLPARRTATCSTYRLAQWPTC